MLIIRIPSLTIKVFKMQWKPNTTVAAVIEKDNRFLLVEEEIDGKLVFNQPAGHLDLVFDHFYIQLKNF